MIDAVILAGGLGTRLQSVISDRPKPLALIGDVPFLELLLYLLAQSGIVRSVVIAAGHKAEKVKEAYAEGERFGLPIRLSIETERLGTGGGLLHALPQTSSTDIVVMNGDSFQDADLPRLLTVHRENNAAATLTLTGTEEPERYGTVLCQADGRVLSFLEKQARAQSPALINAGVYMFSRAALLDLPRKIPMSLETEILPMLIESSAGVFSIISTGRFIDIGLPDTYAAAQSILKDIVEAAGRSRKTIS